MLPETKEIMRPLAWKDDVQIPWDTIISHWNSYWDMEKLVLLEKSPPNVLHADELITRFPQTRFIALICEPYATCESLMRRNQWDASTAIAFWLRVATSLQHTIERYKGKQLFFLSYETLCENPERSCQRMISFLPELEELTWDKRFKLHSIDRSLSQEITDMTADKRARLSVKDRYCIQAALSKHRHLVRYYGYSLECPHDHEGAQNTNPQATT